MKLFSSKPFAFQFYRKQILLCILLFVISCAETELRDVERYYKAFTFVKSKKLASKFQINKRIAIQTFEDNRESNNISYSGLLLIPLIPYASEYYSHPEITHYYKLNFFPKTDLAVAMKSELNDYSIFEKVSYTDRGFPKDVDYLVRVKIKKNQIYNKRTMYGINTLTGPFYSIFSIHLLDTDYATLKVHFELELFETKTKQIIFSKNFELEEREIDWGIKRAKGISESYISLNQLMVRNMSQEIILYFEGNQK